METKPGYKTTEFWVVMATIVAGVLGSLLSPSQAEQGAVWANWIGVICATASACAYAIARGLTKRQ